MTLARTPTVVEAATTIAEPAARVAPVQPGVLGGLDGETIAVILLGSVAILALVFFSVKFAAGFREYRQVQRADAAGEESATSADTGDGDADDANAAEAADDADAADADADDADQGRHN